MLHLNWRERRALVIAPLVAPLAYGVGLTARRVVRLPLGAAGGIIGAAVALLLRPSLRGDLFSIPFPAWAGALIGLVTAEAFVRLLRDSGERPRDAGAAE